MKVPPSSLASLLATTLLLIPTLAQQQDSHLVSESISSLSKRHWDENGNYNITFVHLNDVHAHLEQYRASGTDCPGADDPSVPCLGGYARILSKAGEIRASVKDSLMINCGDEFQGTLFFQYYGSKVISQTLNLLNYSLFTLGNHEFDRGETVLAEFVRDINFPTISTNVKTQHPLLKSLLHPFHIFEEHEMAVVALTTVDTPDISKPEKTTVFGRVEDVQTTVDALLAGKLGGDKGKKVKRVIAMTHIGYEEDIKLAKNTRNIHLIIGGHSHTPLGGEAWYSQGPYPTVVKNLDGEEVFIVTSYRWGEHLGRIDVAFAPESGKVLAYTGAPIRMTEDYPQDEHLQGLIEGWRKPFEQYSKKVVGHTVTDLDQSACQTRECTLGNAVTDAMLYARIANGASIDGAIHNSGGIRGTIPAPNVTQGAVMTAFPFGEGVVDIKMTGRELWDLLEGVASKVNVAGKPVTSSVQISQGMRYSYNPENPKGKRLISLEIGRPNLQPIDFQRVYTIATLDFLATGGDSIFPYPLANAPPSAISEDEALLKYFKKFSPVNVTIEGRIVVTNETKQQREWDLVDAGWGEVAGDAGQVKLGRTATGKWFGRWRE